MKRVTVFVGHLTTKYLIYGFLPFISLLSHKFTSNQKKALKSWRTFSGQVAKILTFETNPYCAFSSKNDKD